MFTFWAKASHAQVALICVILAVCMPGCSEKEKLGAVSGRVTFQGQPVKAGAVVFTNKSKGVFMTAKIDEQGQFKVVMAKGAGLPPGEYQISVSPPVPKLSVGRGADARAGTRVSVCSPEIPRLQDQRADAYRARRGNHAEYQYDAVNKNVRSNRLRSRY